MLKSGRCWTHPSREAHQRCRDCGRWLCDRCLREWRGHLYCSLRCKVRHLARGTAAGMVAALGGPVAAPWALAVVACASALLLAAIGTRVAELIELAAWPAAPAAAPRPTPTPTLHVRLIEGAAELRLEVEGPPRAALLVVADGQPTVILTLDNDGRATLSPAQRPARGHRLEVVLLAGSVLTVTPERAATMTPTPVRPRPTPTVPVSTPTPAPTVARPTAVPETEAPVEDAAGLPVPPVLELVADAGNRLALTFDGGSTATGTDELLDLLRTLHLRVTIFVTGEFVERYPDIVRRALLDGHEIGNHTYSHPHLTSWASNGRQLLLPSVTRVSFERELLRTETAFRRATGRPMAPLWRAPYGEENRALRAWAAELGYLHVRWSSFAGESLDSHDWVNNEHSPLYQHPQRMMERLLAFPRLEGGIVLMHLATDRRDPPWQVLPSFRAALQQRGIEPVTLSELLEDSPTWRDWLHRVTEKHRTAGE